MARPKAFDRDQVLEKAMHVFWIKGYEATSMGELLAAMGVGRQSLYDTFGDKRSLFLAALNKQGLPAEAIPAVIEALAAMVPQRRLADPDEIAGAVLFLASPDASFVTGDELVAGGGLTAL